MRSHWWEDAHIAGSWVLPWASHSRAKTIVWHPAGTSHTFNEPIKLSQSGAVGTVDLIIGCFLLTTWWQLNSFMTEASFRNSIRSLMLADSLTVLMATRISGSSLTTPLAMPSYTMPKEPWPSSLCIVIFSLATSHSSGTYTRSTHTAAQCYISWTKHREMGANGWFSYSLRHWSILDWRMRKEPHFPACHCSCNQQNINCEGFALWRSKQKCKMFLLAFFCSQKTELLWGWRSKGSRWWELWWPGRR